MCIHSVLITVVGFVVVFGSSGVLSRTAVDLNVDTYYIAADTSVHSSQLGHRPLRVTTEITHLLLGWRALGRRALSSRAHLTAISIGKHAAYTCNVRLL